MLCNVKVPYIYIYIYTVYTVYALNISRKESPEKNQLPLLGGSIINCVLAVVTQWTTPSCNRPQKATDNGVRDGHSK